MKKKHKKALKAAQKQVKQLMELLELAPARVPVEDTRTLTEWLVVYEGLLSERNYDQQTVKNYTANLAHLRRLWGEHTVQGLKPHHISSGLRAMLPERSALAQRILGALRDVYVEAIANGWADSSPAAHVRRPPHKVIRKRLSLEAWQGMRELASASRQLWVEPLLLLALVTGQRRADLGKMAFADVFDGHLHVEQQKQAGKGYGARVALPLALRLDAIGMTLGDVIDICRKYAKPGSTLLRRSDGKPIELSSLSARFHELIVAHLGDGTHGLREWPSLHECRSLSERLYRKQGIQTQHLLGHKNADMTDKYNDDRGLSAREWKCVELAAVVH